MKKIYKIGIIPGDGIGRDVTKGALTVLRAVNDVVKEIDLKFKKMDVGGDAILKYDDPFPEKTREGIAQTDAILFGAAGDPYTSRILGGFRRGFDLYANVRPIKSLPGSNSIQPAADFIIVRENTEGLFRKIGYIDGDYHVNLRVFTKKGMERILRFGFELALKKGRKKITFTHKAHVLIYTDEPMRKMFYEIAKEYPGIEAEDMTIDACAMQVVMKPERFDIILAENANGDILSDVGAGIIGGMGFAAGANIGNTMAVFEPIHGTALKYADKDIVNPIAAIMAGKLMFDYLGETEIATQIERSVIEVLRKGKIRTYDIGGNSSTSEVAYAIAESFSLCWKK